MTYDFIDPDALARLGALPFEARRPMIGTVAGRHRSPHRGSSVEFAEYRKYVPGDDTRRLDWKAYARSDRYYIKEFEADTNLRAYFVVDGSGSMSFSSGEHPTKLFCAKRIAAAIAYLLINQGDSAGLSCCRDVLHLELPPSRQAASLQQFFSTLQDFTAQGETGLPEALHSIAEKIPQRSTVVILSDLFVETPPLAKALQHLSFRRHDVIVGHILDPQEINFDFDRPQRFVDLEDETAIVAEPQLIAEEYQEALQTYLQEISKICYDIQADYRVLRSDDSWETHLSDFLLERINQKNLRNAS